ncbi:MAG: hypothetical protein ACFCVF_16775 [Kineosporiaceae bacterium]
MARGHSQPGQETSESGTTEPGTPGSGTTEPGTTEPGTPGSGPCEFCHGHHDPSVHTVQDSVGGGSSSEDPGGSGIEVDVYVEVDDLALAGRRLFAAGDSLDERLRACLSRVHGLEALRPAGDDETGRAFHTGYDPGSTTVCRSLTDIPLAYKVHGVAVQGAAKAYADTDDAAAAGTAVFHGVWGT